MKRNIFEWPSQSSALNPIKDLFSVVKYGWNARTRKELISSLLFGVLLIKDETNIPIIL